MVQCHAHYVLQKTSFLVIKEKAPALPLVPCIWEHKKVLSIFDVLQGQQHAPPILQLTTQKQCYRRMCKVSVTIQCNAALSLWQCLTQHKISLVPHACYAPVVAPSDFLPFPKLKSIQNWMSFQECRNYSNSNISIKQYHTTTTTPPTAPLPPPQKKTKTIRNVSTSGQTNRITLCRKDQTNLKWKNLLNILRH
jgi:hypothetical protein